MAEWQAKNAGVKNYQIIDLSFLGGLTKGGSALTDVCIEIPDLDDIKEAERKQPPTYVPNRNMIFLSLSAAYAESAGIQDIFYGAQVQDEYGYWDCTAEFIEKINSILGLNRVNKLEIHAPFVRMTKTDVVKIGRKLGVDYEKTWSCYRGGSKPCGTCPSCVERKKALT
jgi:7-cyano-7-deazaguanine synthase